MWKRIIAAAKKYGIELSDDVKKHAEALGSSNSDGGEVIKMEMKEQELTDLISRIFDEKMHEQSIQNPGGALNQGTKGHGGLEAYQPQVRVPPDIEAINTQLENFKQLHAKHEAVSKDTSAKLDALQKQVNAMNEALTKMQQAASDENDDDNDDGNENEDGDGKDTEAKTSKGSKGAKGAKGGKAASGSKAGPPAKDDEDKEDGDDADGDDDDEDGDGQQEKVKNAKKVKEQAQTAHAEGVVATSDMTGGNGVTPSGFTTDDQDTRLLSFGDRMNRASRLRRRGIGGS
jgi:hypothetical protein